MDVERYIARIQLPLVVTVSASEHYARVCSSTKCSLQVLTVTHPPPLHTNELGEGLPLLPLQAQKRMPKKGGIVKHISSPPIRLPIKPALRSLDHSSHERSIRPSHARGLDASEQLDTSADTREKHPCQDLAQNPLLTHKNISEPSKQAGAYTAGRSHDLGFLELVVQRTHQLRRKHAEKAPVLLQGPCEDAQDCHG